VEPSNSCLYNSPSIFLNYTAPIIVSSRSCAHGTIDHGILHGAASYSFERVPISNPLPTHMSLPETFLGGAGHGLPSHKEKRTQIRTHGIG